MLAYDRLITDCDLDLYMTFDNEKVGELQAQFLVDHLPKERKKKIVRIYGAKTDNNALLYKRGQDKVLTPLIKKGEIEVGHEDWTQDWRPENAKKIASAPITKAGALVIVPCVQKLGLHASGQVPGPRVFAKPVAPLRSECSQQHQRKSQREYYEFPFGCQRHGDFAVFTISRD